MSDPRLDTWLDALGFVADDRVERALAGGSADDPWATLDVQVAPLTAAQRAHVVGLMSAAATMVSDPLALADADRAVMAFPDDDSIEPFDGR